MSPNFENLGPNMNLFAYLQISTVVAWPSSVYHHKSFNRTYPEAIYSHGSEFGKPLFSDDFTQSNKDIGIQENASVLLWKESVKLFIILLKIPLFLTLTFNILL